MKLAFHFQILEMDWRCFKYEDHVAKKLFKLLAEPYIRGLMAAHCATELEQKLETACLFS